MEDIYQQITDQIIEQIETGTAPWRAGRSVANTLPLRHNGEYYNGVNVLILWTEAAKKGYVNPNWMTFQQAKCYEGQVRKGEKSSRAVFAKSFEAVDEDTGEIKSSGGFLKRYAVFNAGQIDDLPESYYAAKPLKTYDNTRIPELDAFIEATGATVIQGTSPCHYPATNTIEMPPFEEYECGENYYHDLLHELTHWTRVSTRLDRNFGQKKHGDNGYIKEELVAEIGASFLLASFGYAVPIGNSAAYMNEYLEDYVAAMREDKKLIVSAASHASKALAYLQVLANNHIEEAA